MRRHALPTTLLALAALTGCTKTPRADGPAPTGAPTPREPQPTPPAPELDGFVGLLRENLPGEDTRPSDYCLDDGQQWRGAPARLGRINVIGVPIDRAWLGRHVIVWGTREPSLDAVVVKLGPCPPDDRPMAQMRSDWIADEGGYLTTHALLAKTPVLRAQRIEPVSLAVSTPDPEGGATVVLTNPFPAPLTGALRIHHEGGPGKPMPHFEKRPLDLAPGASLTLALDASPPPGPDVQGPRWRLHALDVTGTAGRLTVDVTIPLQP